MRLNRVEFITDLKFSALGSQASNGLRNKIEQLNARTQSCKAGLPMHLHMGNSYNKHIAGSISSHHGPGTS